MPQANIEGRRRQQSPGVLPQAKADEKRPYTLVSGFTDESFKALKIP